MSGVIVTVVRVVVDQSVDEGCAKEHHRSTNCHAKTVLCSQHGTKLSFGSVCIRLRIGWLPKIFQKAFIAAIAIEKSVRIIRKVVDVVPGMVPRILLIRNSSHVYVTDKDSVEHMSSFISRQTRILNVFMDIFKKSAVKKSLIYTADKNWAGEGKYR